MSGKFIVEFLVTTGCNLSCTYCYSRHNSQFMTKDVANDFFKKIHTLLKYYKKDNYHISYFGGEPLLNWDVIEYTLPKFKNDLFCSSIVVITNGLLLNEERVNFLKNNNCGISLSFDGLWQDTNRPQPNNKKTLDFFLENKDLIHKITNSCKVMINPCNFTSMAENLDFFVNEYNFYQPDFCLIRDNIYSARDIEIYKSEIKRLADRVLEYQAQNMLVSVGLFDLYTLDILANQMFGKRDHGCFVGTNGAAYAPDGSFWPCERFRSAGKLKIYDSKTGIIKENIDWVSEKRNTDPRTFDSCKNCEIYDFCNVGCTFSEYNEGDWSKREPITTLCEILKLTYNEAMRVFKHSNQKYKDYIAKRLSIGG